MTRTSTNTWMAATTPGIATVTGIEQEPEGLSQTTSKSLEILESNFFSNKSSLNLSVRRSYLKKGTSLSSHLSDFTKINFIEEDM